MVLFGVRKFRVKNRTELNFYNPIQDYPNVREPLITSAILDTFIEEKSQQPIHSLAEFATYNWEFRRITSRLVRERHANPDKLRKAYNKSIHCSLCWKIKISLNSEKVV